MGADVGNTGPATVSVGELSPADVRRVGLALLGALGAAHDAKIVHRDIKPANILIDEHGVVKLVDFGIASFGDRDLTSTGTRIGTWRPSSCAAASRMSAATSLGQKDQARAAWTTLLALRAKASPNDDELAAAARAALGR